MYSDPHYADSAFAIIGRALEYVTGAKYEEYVTKGILEPLGMCSMSKHIEAKMVYMVFFHDDQA